MPHNHSYFIAITLPEPIHSEVESLKKKIYENYHTRSVLKSPAHITIVPPFFWSNENELIEMVNSFYFKEFPVHLKNYGAFPPSVVYVDVVEDKNMLELYTSFNQYFYNRYPSLKKRHPYPFHPHVTVGNRDWKKEDFTRCWNEMKDKTYDAGFTFGKLSLLKLTESKWQILDK